MSYTKFRIAAIAIMGLAALALAPTTWAGAGHAPGTGHAPAATGHGGEGHEQTEKTKQGMKMPMAQGMSMPMGLVHPDYDAEKGKILFVNKGCITCHSINGVGGEGSPLDSINMESHRMNPFQFVARMWLGAEAMIAFQEELFGEQIEFTGEELSNIVAFVHDPVLTKSFSQADITPEMAKLMSHTHASGAGHGQAQHQGQEEHAPEAGKAKGHAAEETGQDHHGPEQGHAGEPEKMADKIKPHPHAPGTTPHMD